MEYATQAIELEREIQALRATITRLEARRAELSRRASELRRPLRRVQSDAGYLEVVAWFRSPQTRFDLWPLGVLLVGPTSVGGIIFIIVHLSTNGILSAFVWAGIGGAIAAIVLALFMFHPPTERIPERLRLARSEIQSLQQRLGPIDNELSSVVDELQQCRSQVTFKESSILLHRRRLLQRNWRELRGVDWENYLAEVCSALGARVELTKISGDQGVDLVAIFQARRVAIQAKGWSNSVGNSAVQEVVSGQRFYNCHACAVITNSRFTPSAVELAKVNGCSLISEDNFEKFALGDVPL
jgi:HJR/Mrr/RecB family endonuclease